MVGKIVVSLAMETRDDCLGRAERSAADEYVRRGHVKYADFFLIIRYVLDEIFKEMLRTKNIEDCATLCVSRLI